MKKIKILSVIGCLLTASTASAAINSISDVNTAMNYKCGGGVGHLGILNSKPVYALKNKQVNFRSRETSSWDKQYIWAVAYSNNWNSPLYLNLEDPNGTDKIEKMGLFNQAQEIIDDADEDEFDKSFSKRGINTVTFLAVDVDIDLSSIPPFGPGGLENCDATPVYVANEPKAFYESLSSNFTSGHIEASITYSYDSTYSKKAIENAPIKFEWRFENQDYPGNPSSNFLTTTPTINYQPPYGGEHKVQVRVWDGANWGSYTTLGYAYGGDPQNCLPGSVGCIDPF